MKLVYFTSSFPYGNQELWKLREMEGLNGYFDQIVVAPLHFGRQKTAMPLPSGIKVLPPLFESDGARFKWWNGWNLIGRRFHQHISSFASGPVRPCKSNHLKSWVVDNLKVERIFSSKIFRDQVLPEIKEGHLYFFWGKGYAEILPFLGHKFSNRSTVRMHGYDLYREVNDGFIPNQSAIIRSASNILTVSRFGKKYLRSTYSKHAHKIDYAPLGVVAGGAAEQSEDGLFRLVTCAFVSPVKRLKLVVKALKCLPSNFIWSHIGDGPELESLAREVDAEGLGTRVKFLGYRKSTEVARIYEDSPFDLFLNVSSSEGVPVSIMEAMAAGIPVLATNVGGNGEIVDDSVGRLIEPHPTPQNLASHIERLAALGNESLSRLRNTAKQRQMDCYDAQANAKRLALSILNQDTE